MATLDSALPRASSRRRDVFRAPVGKNGPRRRYGSTALERGTDAQGRFIGKFDIDRGLRFFWSQAHRRATAPIVRDYDGRTSGSGGPGVPRPLGQGLTFEKLRQIHARCRIPGVRKSDVAREFGISNGSLHFHLRAGGSASMRAALAEAVPSPIAPRPSPAEAVGPTASA